MRIRIIATGSSKWERFIRRWGVSFLIDENVLFDTFGDAGVLLRNMRKFKIDASRIKHIILSHDDWDHISGLWCLLKDRKDVIVYICPGFEQEIKERLVLFGVKVVELKVLTQIRDGIYSTGELCKESDGEKICEQSVVIKTAKGLTVICGCAHPGIVSIIQYVKEQFNSVVFHLIGGFHLKNNNTATNTFVIKNLQALGVRRISPTHCTGKYAARIMRQVFGQGFVKVKEGDTIEL